MMTFPTYLQAHQHSVQARSSVDFTAPCDVCGRDAVWTATKVRDGCEYDIDCCQEVAA